VLVGEMRVPNGAASRNVIQPDNLNRTQDNPNRTPHNPNDRSLSRAVARAAWGHRPLYVVHQLPDGARRAARQGAGMLAFDALKRQPEDQPLDVVYLDYCCTWEGNPVTRSHG